MTNLVKNWLLVHWREELAPETREALDGGDSLERHRKIIERKPLLRRVYERWYRFYGLGLAKTQALSRLPAIEVGSGAGLVKDWFPEIIRTDVVAHPLVQQVLTAEKLPYGDGALRGIFMLDVLHHLPDPRAFFREASRSLAKGGRIIMVEPTMSFMSRLTWGKFHPLERLDPTEKNWENPNRAGRLTDANMALPWIIFVRDRKIFEKEFPNLKISSVRFHTCLGYFWTGGLTYRPFLPAFLGEFLLPLEDLWVRFFPSFATMMAVEVERI